MKISEEEYLAHYGILRKSGRYPWGSGENQEERNSTFLNMVEDLKRNGLSESQIANYFEITTTQLRAARSIAKNEQQQANRNMAQRLKDKGYSNVAIGQRMNLNESSVRSLLDPGKKDRADVLKTTASMLKDQVDQKGFLDVGTGVEHHIGVSSTKLSTALAVLKEQGYVVHRVKIDQLGTNHQTELKVLAKPGVTQKEVWANRENIRQITEFSDDGGRSFFSMQPPVSISSKRVGIRYAEEGGSEADGVIYIRPGVSDVTLGKSRYAQVRIAVDGTHYLKGMAMYKNDLPDGVDLVFNTNKSKTGNKLDAMKPMKDDPENPFGASISRQIIDPKTKKVTSVMNVVNEEGDWDKWSKNLSSQMLSKQSVGLAKTQLDMTYERRKNQLDEITSLTNPAVRKKLLETYADDTDAASVHLKAAALPRQGSHVILPIKSMREKEIYAPNYRNGERVVLVRYPHGGVFEIPELTVNNRHPEAKSLLGNAKDAVGISHKVAQRLSGADFDGDTVLVISNNNKKIKTAPALEGLSDFDPQRAYPSYEGMRKMTPRMKQQQMGDVSNLITDMTIRGANNSELARAVRHSMVVIDAEKHNLDWKRSAIDNGIPQLKEKYQGSSRSGASTLVSKASAEIRVPKRKPRSSALGGPIDVATGRKVYELTGETKTDRNGKVVLRTEKSKRLAETEDAYTLSSGTPIEKIYAEHSNKLKSLANTARKTAVNTRNVEYSPSARLAYSKEVTQLNAKLNIALRNAPLERQAQVLANAQVHLRRQANPGMEDSELKKIKAQALDRARVKTGAKKERIVISDNEWAAIQAGAISNNKLNQILIHADLEQVKKLATPKTRLVMTTAKQNAARAMLNSGYTQSEIADALGVSVSTINSILGEGG